MKSEKTAGISGKNIIGNIRRKAQVTIFILIGLAIIIAVSFGSYMYYKSASQQSADTTREFLTTQINNQNLNTYITAAMLDIGQDVAMEIAIRGGTFNPQQFLIFGSPNSTDYAAVYGEYTQGKGMQNMVISNKLLRQNIQFEIERVVEKRLRPMLDIKVYEKQGFKVTEGDEFKITARMGDDSIILDLFHPVTMVKGDDKQEYKNFTTTVRVPLGRVYGFAVDITNDECDDGHSTKENYMIITGGKVRIEKFNNYPHEFYEIREYVPSVERDILFRFALKGKDTVAKEVISYANKQGCCVNSYDNYYLKNVPQGDCSASVGKYLPKTDCSTPRNVMPTIEGCCYVTEGQDGKCMLTKMTECFDMKGEFSGGDYTCNKFYCTNLNCVETHSGEPARHGASWCEYEGRVGPGLDYVGSRQYLHSCINGVEYVEPCRDYREEMCMFQKGGDTEYPSKAACKINRWWDCANINDPTACEDKSKRDCKWGAGYLMLSKGKCHPSVLPGFKFWEGNGADVCRAANQGRQGSIKKAYVWGDGAFFYCQRMGDCGDKFNYEGMFSKGHWTNKWGKSPSPNYNTPGFIKLGNFALIGSIYQTKSGATTLPRGGSGGDARCSLWTPIGSDCELCNGDPIFRPCTQYKCKSLGMGCSFGYAEDGTPVCKTQVVYNVLLPNGSVDMSWRPGLSADGATNAGGNGTIIVEAELPRTNLGGCELTQGDYGGDICKYSTPAIPYQEYKIMFSTTQPTLCTMSIETNAMLEQFLGEFTPSVDLNPDGAKAEYDFNLRFFNLRIFPGMEKARLQLKCRGPEPFNLETINRLEIPVSTSTGGEFKLLGFSGADVGEGQEIVLKASMPISYCTYESQKLECASPFYSAPDEGEEVAAPTTDIERLMAVPYNSNVASSSNRYKEQFFESGMEFDYDDVSAYGYYPCYTKVNIPAGTTDMCISCASAYTGSSSSKCFKITGEASDAGQMPPAQTP